MVKDKKQNIRKKQNYKNILICFLFLLLLIVSKSYSRPSISIEAGGQTLLSGDPISSQPSFEITVISSQGVTTSSIQASMDNNTFETLTKIISTDNPTITKAFFNPATLSEDIHSLKIVAIDANSSITTKEVIGLIVQGQKEIATQGIPLCYPNPYNGTGNLSLSYILSKSGNVTLTIHDLMGNQLTKKTYTSLQNGGTAGYNEITCDGKTDNGNALGNGIYIFLIVADGKVIGKGKIAVVK